MSQYSKVLDKTFIAGANFDTTAAEFVYVNMSGVENTVVVASTIAGFPLGILQNGGIGGVKLGGAAVVRLVGTSKLQFFDSIAAGVPYIINSLGLGLPLATNTIVAGRIGGLALQAATASGITNAMLEVTINPYFGAAAASQTVA